MAIALLQLNHVLSWRQRRRLVLVGTLRTPVVLLLVRITRRTARCISRTKNVMKGGLLLLLSPCHRLLHRVNEASLESGESIAPLRCIQALKSVVQVSLERWKRQVIGTVQERIFQLAIHLMNGEVAPDRHEREEHTRSGVLDPRNDHNGGGQREDDEEREHELGIRKGKGHFRELASMVIPKHAIA